MDSCLDTLGIRLADRKEEIDQLAYKKGWSYGQDIDEIMALLPLGNPTQEVCHGEWLRTEVPASSWHLLG